MIVATPRENQGQFTEYSYGWDGTELYMKVHHRVEGCVMWYREVLQ